MIKDGYYLKARCIQNSDISRTAPHIREIWDWILKEANHKDTKVCKRGQCIRTYKDIIEGLSWQIGWRKMTYSKDNCETAMKWLKKHCMITTQKTTRGIIITIINYDKYQDPKNYENHSEKTTKTTREPQTRHTINKNVKNDKNEQEVNNTLQAEPAEIFSEKDLEKKKVDSQVQQVIDAFYQTVNPDISFGNKTTRGACEYLIKKYTFEKTMNAVKFAIEVQGQQYAPTITTPYELKQKMGALRVYYQKANSAPQKGKTILGL